MARKNKIIAFIGPNGAGKSIQMDLLIAYLKKRNIRVRNTWVASHHLFVWVLGILLVKLGYPKDHWTTVNPHLPPTVDFAFLVKGKGKLVRINKLLLLMLELFNLVIVDLFKVRIPRLFGYCIVIEKYLPVTLADLTQIFGSKFLDSLPARFLLSLIPEDLHCVFLNATYESLLKRRGTKTEPRHYLELQCAICEWYAKNNPCLVIDTSKTSIKDTHESIIDYLKLS